MVLAKPIACTIWALLKISAGCSAYAACKPAPQHAVLRHAFVPGRELAFEQMNNAEYIEVEPERKRATVLKKSFSTLLTKKKCFAANADRRRVARQSDYFRQHKHRCEEIWGHLAADGHRVGR